MSIGPLQIVLILVLVLILFGAGKIPRVMGDVGRGIRNLKKGLNSDEDISVEKSKEIQNKKK